MDPPPWSISTTGYINTQDVLADGACTYHSLAYCLSGDEHRFVDVITDCVFVFGKYIDVLYRTRCSFAIRGDVQQYRLFMEEAVDRLYSGSSVTRNGADLDFWGEDAHVIAIGLLYDICIYVYNAARRLWQVFNNDGSRGFICLLNECGHTSVLTASDGTIPAVQHCEIVDGTTRIAFGWDSAIDRENRTAYSFAHVHPWPSRRMGLTMPMSTTSSSDRPILSTEGGDNGTSGMCANYENRHGNWMHCEESGHARTVNIHGLRYEHRDVLADGACTYRSMAYCLSGDEHRFMDIICDCVCFREVHC